MPRANQNRVRRGGKMREPRWFLALPVLLCGLGSAACGDKTPPPPPPCEQKCQDGVALRAVREMMKFAFNFTFQGLPVGTHDLTTDKFARGSARVHGSATSDAAQGVTDVKLWYEFRQALYPKKEDDAEENYVIGIEGAIWQEGKIAVQPSSPTALKMTSESLIVVGTVYDPPINYNLELMACPLEIFQNGNTVSGKLCGRDAGFEF